MATNVEVKVLPVADIVIPPTSKEGTFFDVSKGIIINDPSIFSTDTLGSQYVYKLDLKNTNRITSINLPIYNNKLDYWERIWDDFYESVGFYLKTEGLGENERIKLTMFSHVGVGEIFFDEYIDIGIGIKIISITTDYDLANFKFKININLSNKVNIFREAPIPYSFKPNRYLQRLVQQKSFTHYVNNIEGDMNLVVNFCYLDLDNSINFDLLVKTLAKKGLFPIFDIEKTAPFSPLDTRKIKDLFHKVYSLDVSYELSVTESNLLSKLFTFFENIKVSDKKDMFFYKNFNEILKVTSTDDVFTILLKYFYETLYISDSIIQKDKFRNFFYNIIVSDKKSNSLIKRLYETSFLSEESKNKKRYVRLFTESLNTKENKGKLLKKNYTEKLSIRDIFVRNVSMIISNVMFSSKPYIKDEFKNLWTPIIYEPFKELLPSDYTYKEALIRVIMENNVTAESVPYIAEWKLVADVPDIYETGVANVSLEQPLKIYFDREYHVTPTVSAWVSGGNEAALKAKVSIGVITLNYFEAYVLDSNDNILPARISWQAQGY